MKKIISLLMAVSVLTASVSVMATTEGIVQGDVMMTSAEGIVQDEITATSEEETAEFNTYTGIVKEIAEDSVIVTISDTDYKFMLAEGVELGEITVGDTVEVSSVSALETKDIKEATVIVKVDVEEEAEETAVPEIAPNNYNAYNAVVESVEEGVLTVTIEDMTVTFRTSEETIVLNMNGEQVAEVKAEDKIIVVSTSLLETKDIKFADVIVINNEEKEQSVYYDKFDIVDEQLISADGNLVLNVEDPAEYAGAELIVFYSMQTMSIPAQTAPDRIIVMQEPVSISFNVGDKVLDINGIDREVEIAPYVIGEGTTLVPLRVISEAFGATVGWAQETQTVTIFENGKEIKLTIGSKTALVDGEEVTMEEAPELLGSGVTMVPLRFISETFEAEVGYEHETQLITVSR